MIDRVGQCVGLVVVATGCWLGTLGNAGWAAEPAAHADRLLLVLPPKAGSEQPPARVEIQLGTPAEPWSVATERAADALFQFLDRNDDGTLATEEAARLPTPFEIRRLLWGAVGTPLGGAWQAADTSGDGQLTLAEVRDFYRKQAVGVTVAVGKPPHAAALTQHLLNLVDVDHDDRLTAAEWKTLWQRLAVSDKNEDELIAAAELLPGILYPGSQASTVLRPIELGDASLVCTDEVATRAWLDVNHDDELQPAELARLQGTPADLTWQTAWSQRLPTSAATGTPAKYETVGGVQFTLWTDLGQAPGLSQASARGMRDQFRAADRKLVSQIELGDAQGPALTPLRNLITFADRDGNGRLGQAELNAWLETMLALTQGQVLVSVIDYGPGLFEFLDADASGALSASEVASASQRLTAAGVLHEAQWQPDRLPQTVRACVSCGHPRGPFPPAKRVGPEWFQNLDRNADGVVSPREFVGPPAIFSQIDTDHDQVISAAEAAQFRTAQ